MKDHKDQGVWRILQPIEINPIRREIISRVSRTRELRGPKSIIKAYYRLGSLWTISSVGRSSNE